MNKLELLVLMNNIIEKINLLNMKKNMKMKKK